jgi:predicted outer membrane repeat protein
MMGMAVVIEVRGLDFQGHMAFPGLSRGGYSEVADSGGGIYSGGHGSLDEIWLL